MTSRATAEAPRSWRDLTNARWRDQLAVGHPGYSGAIGSWCVAMRAMYGWDYFRALERNRPQIGRSAGDTTSYTTPTGAEIEVVIHEAKPFQQ